MDIAVEDLPRIIYLTCGALLTFLSLVLFKWVRAKRKESNEEVFLSNNTSDESASEASPQELQLASDESCSSKSTIQAKTLEIQHDSEKESL